MEQQPRYAMYLRKSRADLDLEAMGEGETLKRHETELFALAAKHEIHPDQITIYREIVSGDSIDGRPEVQRLLTDVCSKKYKGVLVKEIERLARGNTKDQGEVADAFQYSNTLIITPAKVYDTNQEVDQEYFEFGLFMSRREYKTIRRRLEAGKKQAVMEGNYLPSRRIFGYNIERRSKKERILVINPEEEKLVHMIFDWYSEDGHASGWIARELTRMGIPTTRGGKEWNRGTIRDMLDNVHYIGKVSWDEQNTVRVMDEKTGKLVKKRVMGTPEIYEGKHEAIISVEQFEKVQQIIKERRMVPAKVGMDLINPFAGILKCKDCGRSMVLMQYTRDNRVPRFTHPHYLNCKKKSLPVEDVTNSIVDALNASMEDFKVLMESNHNQESQEKHYEIIKAMETELAKQEKRRQRLFDSWEADDGTYTKEEFIERKQMYASTIEKMKKQIQEAKAAIPEPVNYEEEIVNIKAVIERIKDPTVSAEEKNDFLKQYIDLITYDVIDLGRGKGGKPVLEVFLK